MSLGPGSAVMAVHSVFAPGEDGGTRTATRLPARERLDRPLAPFCFGRLTNLVVTCTEQGGTRFIALIKGNLNSPVPKREIGVMLYSP